MKNKEILKSALRKAINNGLSVPRGNDCKWAWEPKTNSYWYWWFGEDENGEKIKLENPFCPKPEELIFSHDFAKAFWGEAGYMAYYAGYDEWSDATKETDSGEYDEEQHDRKPNWQYHLQQMVLKEDPIKYLSQFL